MKKQAHYKSTDQFLKEKGIVVGQKSSARDKNIARTLVRAISRIEDFIFEGKAQVELLDATNNFGVAATYHGNLSRGQDGTYDIYIPNLIKRLEEVLMLFPEKAYLRDSNRKLIFIAAHKVRHRLQIEGEVNLITPETATDNYLLNKIVKSIKNNEDHNLCSCSYLDNKESYEEMEFDAMISQHYAFSKLKGFNHWGRLQDVPRYVWKSIAEDLLI